MRSPTSHGSRLLDYRTPTIVDCTCGLRYMRSGVRSLITEIGHYRCTCGHVIGAWNGLYRLQFEPEEEQPLN